MAVLALTDAFAHIHGYDFTTDTNELSLSAEVAALDSTTFGDAWTELTPGVKSSTFALAGFWQSAASQAVDPESFPDLGVANRVLTFGPLQTENDVAYMTQLGKYSYELLGAHGELAPFRLGCVGTDGVGVVRGRLAKEKGAVSATGQLGSVLNLGAVSATQFVYATFHVFTAGTTITVKVQSDDTSAFASPVGRGDIGPLTAVGGTWMLRVAGPFTDTWWRLQVTAITGTFTVAGAIAIQ